MIEFRLSFDRTREVWDLEVVEKLGGKFMRSECVGIGAYSGAENVAAALRLLAKNVEERMT